MTELTSALAKVSGIYVNVSSAMKVGWTRRGGGDATQEGKGGVSGYAALHLGPSESINLCVTASVCACE